MNRTSRITVSLLLALSVVGCADVQNNPKQAGGTLLGGALGGLAGAQFGSGKGQIAAAVAGALLGAFMGSEVGKSLDRADHMYAERTAQTALETTPAGQVSEWRNPDSGHSGTVTPTRTYVDNSGSNCREFETTVYVEGRDQTATGRACRQSDGTWRIVQ